MSKPEFIYVTHIKTTQKKLWKALTSAEFTKQYWFGRSAESNWKIGMPITYHYNKGKDIDINGKVS